MFGNNSARRQELQSLVALMASAPFALFSRNATMDTNMYNY